jgi:hypothetical protein
MHIDHENNDVGVSVSYLGSGSTNRDNALKEFRRNINTAEPSAITTTLTFLAKDLDVCEVDNRLTKSAPSVVLTGEMRRKLSSDGITFRYPHICRGDPFYLLFFFRNDTLAWIWEYAIRDSRFDLRWSFVPESEQRRVPKQALSNLANPTLWYSLKP